MQDSLFDYPGWTVLVDDKEVATSPASVSGQLTFSVPAGSHNVSIELRPTPIRRWSYNLSLAILALMALAAAFAFVSRWNRANKVDEIQAKKAERSGAVKTRR